MAQLTFFLFAALLFSKNAGATECENGWTYYNDEICVQIFPDLLTYDETKSFCASQGTETSKSTLVFVKEMEMQELLVTYTNDVFDNVWLGGRYNEEAGQFLWDDGDPLTYTNWQDGSPRNESDSNFCIDFKPVNAKTTEGTPGKWTDANCHRRNRVMCQKMLTWTLEHAIEEIIKLRRNFQTVASTVFPVGSIYVEYYGQPSPSTLWPGFTWEDISSTYAGLFFRVEGGGAEEWGITQDECAPRIVKVQNFLIQNSNYPREINVSRSGWSDRITVGPYVGGSDSLKRNEGLGFYTANCEVRPKNKAIRIWKRAA